MALVMMGLGAVMVLALLATYLPRTNKMQTALTVFGVALFSVFVFYSDLTYSQQGAYFAVLAVGVIGLVAFDVGHKSRQRAAAGPRDA